MSKYPFSWLRHSRDVEGDFGHRVILHIPVGMFLGFTFPLSVPMVYLLRFYERNEDVHTEDQAWKDVYGVMVGMAVGIALQIAILAWAFTEYLA